ncbi:MAG: phosphoribosylanthranilate isomerase [Gallionella sp.]|nr:phosphoribosylanthranilate isomerase [Gallionella sp.]MCK9353603.1 phosphoribosylanthranilate isomerase [Gallionella sp.]
MTRVKICGITRAEDARTVAASGADAIGLVFYAKSPRHVSAEQAAQLVAALPPFVTTVGLFVDAEAAFVREVLATVPLDVLQFHGDESPEYCTQFGRPYLKAIRVKAGVDLLQCAAQFSTARALLLDAYVAGVPGGTGATFDWGLIPRQLPLPVILSGGLDAENVAEAIERVRPYAVDVSSGVEAGKGIKDAAKVAAFVNEVKRVDVQLSR